MPATRGLSDRTAVVCLDGTMARRRSGRLGAALTLFALYRRLPRRHRRMLRGVARRHGLRVAITTWTIARGRREARRDDV
jgi:hypothetical protein